MFLHRLEEFSEITLWRQILNTSRLVDAVVMRNSWPWVEMALETWICCPYYHFKLDILGNLCILNCHGRKIYLLWTWACSMNITS